MYIVFIALSSYSSSDSSRVPDASTPTQPHPIDKGTCMLLLHNLPYHNLYDNFLIVSVAPNTPSLDISGERLLHVAVKCGGVGVCLCDGDGEVVRADVTGLSTTVQLFSDNTWISAR